MTRVVIDIPDEDFTLLCEAFGEVELKSTLNLRLQSAVAHGVVLPEGHGDLIDRDELFAEYPEIAIEPYINAPIVIEADKENGND